MKKKINYLLEEENETITFQPSSTNKTKIGLGSHFMFMLILSNIINNVISLIFEEKYKDVKPLDKKDDSTCKILGFCYLIAMETHSINAHLTMRMKNLIFSPVCGLCS